MRLGKEKPDQVGYQGKIEPVQFTRARTVPDHHGELRKSKRIFSLSKESAAEAIPCLSFYFCYSQSFSMPFFRPLLDLFLADGKFQICNAEYLNIIRFGIRPTWNPEFNRIHFNLDDHFWHFSHVVENFNSEGRDLEIF